MPLQYLNSSLLPQLLCHWDAWQEIHTTHSDQVTEGQLAEGIGLQGCGQVQEVLRGHTTQRTQWLSVETGPVKRG